MLVFPIQNCCYRCVRNEVEIQRVSSLESVINERATNKDFFRIFIVAFAYLLLGFFYMFLMLFEQ